jgi:hypothetical protein
MDAVGVTWPVLKMALILPSPFPALQQAPTLPLGGWSRWFVAMNATAWGLVQGLFQLSQTRAFLLR